MEVGQCAWRRDRPRVLLRCLSAETGWGTERATERETERESWRGEVRGTGGRRRVREATDCQIAAWQSSVASGTVIAATTASVVVAVIWRRDRGKQGNQSGAEWGRTELLNAISLVFIFTWLTWLEFFFITPIHFLQQAEKRPTTDSELFFTFRPWKSL